MRLIDADALHERIQCGQLSALGYEGYDDYDNINSVDDCLDAIKDAPTVEPKTGKWLITMLDHEAFGVRPRLIYCSSCNQCYTHPTKFCPNCGARMQVQ